MTAIVWIFVGWITAFPVLKIYFEWKRDKENIDKQVKVESHGIDLSSFSPDLQKKIIANLDMGDQIVRSIGAKEINHHVGETDEQFKQRVIADLALGKSIRPYPEDSGTPIAKFIDKAKSGEV